MAGNEKLSQAAQKAMGIPQGLKSYSAYPFGYMNLQDAPTSIQDQEFTWIENFVRLGNGKLRCLWDSGASIYTAPGGSAIIHFFFYTLATSYYVAVFLDDGSAIQVNMDTLGATTIGSAGTFYTGGGLPACTQWGTQYLLISNNNTVNDYWIWDGTLLYQAGTVAPNGVVLKATGKGYNSTPTVTAYGGLGSGLTFLPFVNAGGVVNVKILTPGTGYQVGDVVQLAFSGGGSDTTPILQATLNSGNVAAVNVTAGGAGYTSAPAVAFTGGGGSGAAGTAIVSSAVSSIAVGAGGSGYTTATISIEGGGGTGATAKAVVNTGISSITVGSGGVNYTYANILITGNGTGASATATITGGVNSVSITSSGTAYTSAPTVAFTGGGGSGATGVATISGAVSSTAVTAGGAAYATAPTVIFTGGGGTGAAATANLVAGAVDSLTITSPGTGYTSAPTISFSGGGGAGATATASISSGVVSVFVTSAGTGYTSPPTVGFSGGGGSGAAATSVTKGTVSAITVVSSGIGYTTAAINIVGDGSGATATATVGNGAITSITLTSGGTGYTSVPTVAITGDGTGATATASIAAGVVTGVSITNGGTGYTSAPTVSFSGGGGTGASVVALLAPSGVAGVTVTNGGTGFVYAPTITFVGGDGTGASGKVILTPTAIDKINVVSGGTGYFVAPTVTLIGPTGEVDGSATAVVQNGSVIAVNVVNAGATYTGNLEVVFTPVTHKNDTLPPGTGAAATVSLRPTSIASVQMSNYGTGYTTAPAVEVTPGANNSAYATVELMPYGVSGSAMETYQQRVWIVNPKAQTYATVPSQGNFAVSAPGSLTDFATSDGGVLFINSDSFLQTRYVGIKQSNGYLYFFGDGSVSVVSGVTTSGSPSTTNFSYQPVDPQTGLQFRDTLQDFSKSILFVNETGQYGLYGGSAAKISDKLNDLFDTAIFPPTGIALTPTSATATIHNIRYYVTLMTVQDPDSGAYTNKLILWDEKGFVMGSQSVALTRIGTQKVASTFKTYGTDGTSLYPLFQTPSSTLVKKLYSKVYGAGESIWMMKELDTLYIQAQNQASQTATIDFDVTTIFTGLSEQSDYDSSTYNVTTVTEQTWIQAPSLASPAPYWPVFGTGTHGGYFISLQTKFVTESPDFILGGLVINYRDYSMFR